MHLRPRFVATHLLLLSCVAFGVVLRPRAALAQGQGGGDEPVKDGKWLYTRNCSGCHNDNGDGRGATILALGLTARDFKQGGFAFGDSREAITRTVNTGIPGRSPMPSFKGILKDEEIALVVDYVRTLMPPRKDEAPKNTEMIVKDRPVIARGKLPPLVEGGKDIPRGLLIGTPEGMTFEYDLSDVKLLGVRLGGFADREDWSDRGGAYLKPLGQLIYRRQSDGTVCGADSSDTHLITSPPTIHPSCVLESTWVRGNEVGLRYRCIDGVGGPTLWVAEETIRPATCSSGPGYTRSWNLNLSSGISTAWFSVGDAHEEPWRKWATKSGRNQVWSCNLGADGFEVVFLRASTDWDGPDHTDANSMLALSGSGTLRATTIRTREWNDKIAMTLSKELGQ